MSLLGRTPWVLFSYIARTRDWVTIYQKIMCVYIGQKYMFMVCKMILILIILSFVSCTTVRDDKRNNIKTRESKHTYVIAMPGAELYREIGSYSKFIPCKQIKPAKNAANPYVYGCFRIYKVIADYGDWVQVSTEKPKEISCHAGSSLLNMINAVFFVKKTQLALSVKRNILNKYEDDTYYQLKPGVPILKDSKGNSYVHSSYGNLYLPDLTENDIDMFFHFDSSNIKPRERISYRNQVVIRKEKLNKIQIGRKNDFFKIHPEVMQADVVDLNFVLLSESNDDLLFPLNMKCGFARVKVARESSETGVLHFRGGIGSLLIKPPRMHRWIAPPGTTVYWREGYAFGVLNAEIYFYQSELSSQNDNFVCFRKNTHKTNYNVDSNPHGEVELCLKRKSLKFLPRKLSMLK